MTEGAWRADTDPMMTVAAVVIAFLICLGIYVFVDLSALRGGNSFTLQPLSVSGIVGGGASLGIQSFELR